MEETGHALAGQAFLGAAATERNFKEWSSDALWGGFVEPSLLINVGTVNASVFFTIAQIHSTSRPAVERPRVQGHRLCVGLAAQKGGRLRGALS